MIAPQSTFNKCAGGGEVGAAASFFQVEGQFFNKPVCFSTVFRDIKRPKMAKYDGFTLKGSYHVLQNIYM